MRKLIYPPLLALIVAAASPCSFAASRLYSSVDSGERSLGSSSPSLKSVSSSTSVFNLSISLEEDPQGDDEYPADSGAGDDAQNKFELKLEEFADAVYQMTNGAHKIGRITVFRGGIQSGNSDVLWSENCPRNEGPRAWPNGFGVPGKRIYMCTNWLGAPNLMDTPKGAGFTLAHEWGHYTYGLYDEYSSNCGGNPESDCWIGRPRSTDTKSSPSIMHNQWNAAQSGGDQDWLEFSTSGVEPFLSNADGNDENAQARVFGEPAWTTLTRNSNTDPKYDWVNRTFYTNLVAPSAADLTVNDDESTARSDLEIVWAGNQVVELMLDTSGSMGRTLMENAKSAADLLISQLPPGGSAIGVGRFTSSASQVYPVTDIPDPDTGIRTAARAEVATFRAGGGTDIEEAALLALTETQNFQSGTRPSVVFLLTDGRSRVNEATVINAYRAAGVPLITFGFGSGVDANLLQNLAAGTGGQYFFSPTSLARIQEAFVAASAAVSSGVLVSSATDVATGASTSTRKIEVDSTLSSVSLNVGYPGNVSDLSIRLLDPSSNALASSFTCVSSIEVSCSLEFDPTNSGTGSYTLELTNNLGSDIDVSVLVSATPKQAETYDIAVDFSSVNYPESLVLSATVSQGAAIAGLDVSALVTLPDSTTLSVVLKDDGLNSDGFAGDGIYTADIPYNSGFAGNGTYTAVVSASNASGNAVTTFENVSTAVGEDGNGVTPVPKQIAELFNRTGVATATVSGSQSDDHEDDLTSASCTVISDDNIDNVGRIDSAGDIDCFAFTSTVSGSDLVVRLTSLSSSIDPVLDVYDSTGINLVKTVTLNGSENKETGLIFTIPSGSVDPLGNVVGVAHADPLAISGGYAISVGSPLASDTPVKAVTPPQQDNSGGGSSSGGGSAGYLLLLLLSLAGIMKFRYKES